MISNTNSDVLTLVVNQALRDNFNDQSPEKISRNDFCQIKKGIEDLRLINKTWENAVFSNLNEACSDIRMALMKSAFSIALEIYNSDKNIEKYIENIDLILFGHFYNKIKKNYESNVDIFKTRQRNFLTDHANSLAIDFNHMPEEGAEIVKQKFVEYAAENKGRISKLSLSTPLEQSYSIIQSFIEAGKISDNGYIKYLNSGFSILLDLADKKYFSVYTLRNESGESYCRASNYIDETQFSQLVELLNKHDITVKELNLLDCIFNNNHIPILLQLKNLNQIKSLFLSNRAQQYITPNNPSAKSQRAEVHFNTIYQFRHISPWYLSHFQDLSPENIKTLIERLVAPNQHFGTLCLRNLDAQCVTALFNTLNKNASSIHRIDTLDISCSKINNDMGMLGLCTLINENKIQLKSLILGGCDLDNTSCARQIANALESNTSLETVDLRCNELPADCQEEYENALKNVYKKDSQCEIWLSGQNADIRLTPIPYDPLFIG